MVIKVKTKKVFDAFNVLNNAKYTKLDDTDKIKVWKIARAFKSVAEKFDDDSKNAAETFKPEGFDENLQKAQEYENAIKNKNADVSQLKMGAAEYDAFVREIRKCDQLVGKAIEEFAEKEVRIEFEPISEEAFGKLMSSNEWDMSQTMKAEIIVG